MKQGINKSILLGSILLISLLVRIWGIGYDLPYIYHPDEPGYINIAQRIFKTGDLNPHFFKYPSLFFYINAGAYTPYYFLGKFSGAFTSRRDLLPPKTLAMGVTKSPMPNTVLLGRMVSVIFGVGAVGLTFLIGKQLTGKLSVGMLASLMMAISPPNVSHSGLITPDSFVVFFAAASFLATVWIYRQGKTWQYILAGLCIGLAASSKYNGGLIVLPLLFVHFFYHGKTALKERNLYLALLLGAFGFFAATPFALIDFSKFLADVRFEASHYATGHAGMEGDTLKWYLEYMWRTAGIVYFFAILEILRGIYSRNKPIILLSIFPIVYFIFINSFVVRNDRTFLPLTPFLFLLAASLLVNWMNKAGALREKERQKRYCSVVVGLAFVSLMQPASGTIVNTLRLTTVNSRETARQWIANDLPAGTKIAIESYSPFIEPSQFSIHASRKMINHTPEWYIAQGFDYLIFSEGMYGRFFREPARYGKEISQYNKMFEQYYLLRMFTDGGYEIRVYAVKRAARRLPTGAAAQPASRRLPKSGLSGPDLYCFECLICGLMSSTGVPSNMSMPLTAILVSEMDNTSNTESPMGLGRTGEQMLKTPLGPDLWGGVCLSFAALNGGLW